MVASTGFVAGSIACEQHRNTWCDNVGGSSQHVDLKTLVDTLFLARRRTTFVELKRHVERSELLRHS